MSIGKLPPVSALNKIIVAVGPLFSLLLAVVLALIWVVGYSEQADTATTVGYLLPDSPRQGRFATGRQNPRS
jgi:hypothetical protein